jgi:ankyrin repeat protein
MGTLGTATATSSGCQSIAWLQHEDRRALWLHHDGRDLAATWWQVGRQAAELNSQLCVVAQAGDAVAVEHLLLADVDPDVAFFRGDTTLMWVAWQGHSDVVDLLLGSSAAPDLQSADGSTALIWAANCGHADCVRLLLSAGARRVVRDREGRTALQRAEAKGHAEVAALLRT